MAETSTNVTEGSGKRLHGWDRTISSVLVQDQFTIPSEYPYASYIIAATGISVATTADHIMQVMAGSTNYVRIRSIKIGQAGLAAAGSSLAIDLYRLTTAGTGGTTVTPAKLDVGDAAAGATAMTIPTAKGTESTLIWRERLILRSAYSTTGGADDEINWVQKPNAKPLIIAAGTSNGIALKVAAGVATTPTVDIAIEIVETAWLGA